MTCNSFDNKTQKTLGSITGLKEVQCMNRNNDAEIWKLGIIGLDYLTNIKLVRRPIYNTNELLETL